MNFQNPICSVILSVKAATVETVCKLQYDSEIAEDCTIPLQLHLRLWANEVLEVSLSWQRERKRHRQSVSSIRLWVSHSELKNLMFHLTPKMFIALLCYLLLLYRQEDHRTTFSSYTSPCFLTVFGKSYLNNPFWIIVSLVPNYKNLIESKHVGFVLYIFPLPAASKNNSRCHVGYSTLHTLYIKLEAVLCRTATVCTSIILTVKWKAQNHTEVPEGVNGSPPCQWEVRDYIGLVLGSTPDIFIPLTFCLWIQMLMHCPAKCWSSLVQKY